MKRIFTALVAVTIIYSTAFGWGQKGHDTIAYIAECNVSPEVYSAVVKALGGHSFVYYANWMDNASHTAAYSYTKTWHYANVDKGFTYETMKKNERGDVVVAINEIVAKLKAGTLTAEQTNLNLRMLIHLVGDCHAPMHAGHLSDLGGNQIMIKFFGREKKLHAIWDTDLVEFCHKWSYTEWQQQIDRLCPAEMKMRLSEGTPEQWLDESRNLAADIYINTPSKTEVSFDYVAHYAPTIENQILKGGLRLARILTEIYSDTKAE